MTLALELSTIDLLIIFSIHEDQQISFIPENSKNVPLIGPTSMHLDVQHSSLRKQRSQHWAGVKFETRFGLEWIFKRPFEAHGRKSGPSKLVDEVLRYCTRAFAE